MIANANDWVQQRLTEWADVAGGGWMAGWNTQCAYFQERGSREHQAMSQSVVVTDQAVARVKLQSRRFWKAIRLKYLRHQGPKELAIAFALDDAEPIVGAAESAVGMQITILEV